MGQSMHAAAAEAYQSYPVKNPLLVYHRLRVLMFVDDIIRRRRSAAGSGASRTTGHLVHRRASPVEEFYAEHFDNEYMANHVQIMTIAPADSSRVDDSTMAEQNSPMRRVHCIRCIGTLLELSRIQNARGRPAMHAAEHRLPAPRDARHGHSAPYPSATTRAPRRAEIRSSW